MGNTPVQTANLHTFFDIVTICVLFQFGNMLAKFSEFVLKVKQEAEKLIIKKILPIFCMPV